MKAADMSELSKAMEALMHAANEVNRASARLRSNGLSVQISVNGYDYGDQIRVRIEGDLPLPAQQESETSQ